MSDSRTEYRPIPPEARKYSNVVIKRNAENVVRRALEDGIYTMLLDIPDLDDPRAAENLYACHTAIDESGHRELSAVIRVPYANVVPCRRLALIVYNSNLRNPYLDYQFRHNSIIIRESRRSVEQTVQLIEDARRIRGDLDDLIVHTCVTQQHDRRKYLIVLCRGVDTYRRVFYKGGKKRPVHDSNTAVMALPKNMEKTYMLDCLRRFGNTVVDKRFIKHLGAKGTEKWLSTHLRKRVYLRKVEVDNFYVAETWKQEDHNG